MAKETIRLTVRWDKDLISLYLQGYDLGAMAYEALRAFVYHKSVRFYIPTASSINIEDRRPIRIRFTVDDPAILDFLNKGVKTYQKNNLYKMLLRGSMVRPNYAVLLTDSKLLSFEQSILDDFDTKQDDVVICKPDRRKRRNTWFLKKLKKDIQMREQEEQAYHQNNRHENEVSGTLPPEPVPKDEYEAPRAQEMPETTVAQGTIPEAPAYGVSREPEIQANDYAIPVHSEGSHIDSSNDEVDLLDEFMSI